MKNTFTNLSRNKPTSVAISRSVTKTNTLSWASKLLCSLLFCLFLLQANIGNTQNVSSYCFSQTTGTYSTIFGTNFSFAGGSGDDGYSALTNIGFNFVYHGVTFTQFSVSTNGYIQLGTLASFTTNYSPLSTLANCIAFCGGNGKANGYPSYITSGTAPNRVLTVQYTNWYVVNTLTTNTLTVQIQLYETSNIIKIVYGPAVAVTHVSRQVGLTGNAFTDFNIRKSTTSWATTTSATVNTDTIAWSSTVYPASGLTFTWTPATAIVTHPSTASQHLCPSGISTAISVAASGATGYQWYKNTTASNTGGTLLTGAISSSYTPATSINGTLYYYCVVSNSCNSVNSNVSGAIVVGNPPTPTSVTATPSIICTGSNSNLNATASGYTINWYDAATGGTLVGSSNSGANFSVSPASNIIYYAEGEGANYGSQTFSYTGTIVNWTVPSGVTTITITAKGAQGGQYAVANPGGLGASVQGDFAVTAGQQLSILVGGQPACASCMPGGGGGTFVALGASYTTATPMIVAGGGGGSYSGGSGQGGQITNITTTGDGGGPQPGTNGNGAPGTTCGGGGGGFYSSGGNDITFPTYGVGGAGFQQGGAGGISLSYGPGGFGGGATADYYSSCNMQAGAGGGYSGGSGYNSNSSLSSGNGGGSFNSGTNQVNAATSNSGDGQVLIAYSTPGCASPARAQVSVTVVTCVGIAENGINTQFSMYPNPANDKITVETTLTDHLNAVISVYNIEGKLLLEQAMQLAKTDLNIMHLAKGMYYLNIKTDKGTMVKKFIKE